MIRHPHALAEKAAREAETKAVRAEIFADCSEALAGLLKARIDPQHRDWVYGTLGRVLRECHAAEFGLATTSALFGKLANLPVFCSADGVEMVNREQFANQTTGVEG